jgi:UDP-N-acetyl-2-amino-2-deoxyglucuronate dehydrogenase
MTLRAVLIGLGDVAIAHLEGYRDLSSIKVVAGADVRADRARQVAARYDFTPYHDYRELLDRERPDIACVLTTVKTHREITEATADRGVHVLCEKPLALTVEDADAMIARCRDRGVKLFYAASYRFLPAVVKARELIQAGALGEVQLMVETMMGGTGAEGYHGMGFEHYPAGGPGGSGWGLMDHGIHLVDVFEWISGSSISAVFGRGQISGEKPGSEYMVMEFQNGASGHLIYHDATWSAVLPGEGLFSWGPEWYGLVKSDPPGRGGGWQEQPGNIRVYGTHGALRIYHYANQLYLRTARGLEQIALEHRPMPAQFGAELGSFARSITNGSAVEVPGEIGREALRAVLGVYQSMRTGARVSLAPRT